MKRIIEENIPSKEELDKLMEFYRAKNPTQLGWLQQADGKYRLEAVLTDATVGESAPDNRTLILE
jgi:hypothetical protein